MSKQEILDAPVKLVEYGVVEAGLDQLRKDLAGVQFDVTTTEGNKAARAARQRCVSIRTSADAAYNDWNKPMLEKQRAMRAKLAEIKDAVKEVEEPIDAQIKAEEQRKAEEKAERERIEAERRQAIDQRIWGLGHYAVGAVGLSSDKIAAMIETLHAEEVNSELFGERVDEAENVKCNALAKLKEMHGAALAREAEQEKLAAERAELQRQREEQEKRDAEAKAKADAEEAARQAEIAKQQAELKAQQDEIERQKREIEEAKRAAERAEKDRLAKIAAEEQAKLEAEERAEREKAEAEAVEAARRERVQFELNGPGAASIVEALALHYQVSEQVVVSWLAAIDFSSIKAKGGAS